MDEKDTLIISLQSQLENHKAEMYKLQLQLTEEKQKHEQVVGKVVNESEIVQTELRRIADEVRDGYSLEYERSE